MWWKRRRTDEPADVERAPRRTQATLMQWRTVLTHVVRWIPLVLLSGLVAISLSTLVWLLFATDMFTIQAVSVVDARPHVTEGVQGVVQESLAGGVFGHHIFFVQTDILERDIIRQLPTVRDVHITRKLPGTLRVVIQEQQAALLLLANGAYYLVSSEGIPYERARLETLPGTVLPTVKSTDDNATVTIGAPAMSAELVALVNDIYEAMPDAVDARVVETRAPSLAAREVHAILDSNWQVRFDATRPASVQLHTLQRVVSEIITPEEATDLEYIDLRIPNRVYYRTRGARAATTVTAEEENEPAPEQ